MEEIQLGEYAMIKKIITLMILGCSISTVKAEPILTSNIIESINTDKSYYQQNDVAQVDVKLKNNTGSNFSGNVTATIYGRGIQIGSLINTSVSNLPQNSSTDAILNIPVRQNADHQGYYIKIDVKDSSNNIIDTQSTAIDESPDWWVYPRQCWFVGAFTDWGGWNPSSIYGTPETDIKSLNAFKCNNLQMYNLLYRWHLPMPTSNDETYVNGDGLNVSVDMERHAISTAKKYKMGTLMYMPIYSANKGIVPNFQNDGSGVDLSWAVFTNNCGATNSCKISDAWNFSTNIAIMNTQNNNWQYYWAEQTKKWQKQLGFDAMFGDTYGTIDIPLWDINGNRMDNSKMYSSFITAVENQTNIPMVINPAGTYMEQDLVQSGYELYHFTERWNNSSDIGNFGNFLDKSRQVWNWANRKPYNIGLDWDMGMNKTLGSSSTCNYNGGNTVCNFNLPGVLYQEATMLATGAHHAWIVDGQMVDGNGARFISNDDYPIGNMLTPTSQMIQAEYDYQNFGVAYEKILRMNIEPSTVSNPSITSGATGSTTASAGSVWLIQNHRSGMDILSLLNYQQMSSDSFNDVNDNAANAAEPTTTGELTIKMYYTSGSIGNLYMASPDINHGISTQITYTSGSDTNGNFITFTLPSLKYWDLVWLENNISNSDYNTP